MTPIYNVTDTIFRGPRPDSEAYALLRLKGVKTVLNLEGGIIELLTQKANGELKSAHDNRINLLYLDVPAILAPSKEVVELALSILTDSFYGKIFLHCKAGVDRTGYIVAAYRMRVEKRPLDEAVNEMLRMGFHTFPYFFWINSLRTFL